MSNEELIEKLREDGKFLGGNFGKLMHEAADALEAKAAPMGEREAYEAWKFSMNLMEENQQLKAELARLRAGQEPVAYQCREIGEGDWADCDKKWFDYCERSPLHDTRKLYTTPQPSAVQIKASAHKVYDVPLCRLSDAKRAIAELREEDLRRLVDEEMGN